MSWVSDFCLGQVQAVVGTRWKALDDHQREKYEVMAAADKKRYEKEKAAWDAVSASISLA